MEIMSCSLKGFLVESAWNAWCLGSIVGIWPRFIEPYCLMTTNISLTIPNLPKELKGLKILQFSDLHINDAFPNFFLNKIANRITRLKPDIIVFTGDFLCCSRLPNAERLKNFLNKLSAPFGCYAILGNHDYTHFVSINDKGEYDCVDRKGPPIVKGFKRLLFKLPPLLSKTTERAYKLDPHQELLLLLDKTHFQLLRNKTELIDVNGSKLNICGLGEYMLGDCCPEEAFEGYNNSYPGIILAHNPDTFPMLQKYPGDVILAGHSHGGQIYLPGIWKKLTQMENMKYHKGLFQLSNKYGYVNRGLGGTLKFRWFAPPELLLLTL